MLPLVDAGLFKMCCLEFQSLGPGLDTPQVLKKITGLDLNSLTSPRQALNLDLPTSAC